MFPENIFSAKPLCLEKNALNNVQIKGRANAKTSVAKAEHASAIRIQVPSDAGIVIHYNLLTILYVFL